MFSFATMYAPPPVGYAWIVCRYENATIAEERRDDEADRNGVAEAPTCRRRSSVARMKSVAYATDDSASDESTARPVTRDRRS